MRILFFLLFLGTLNILRADRVKNIREIPSSDKFRTEDPYKSTNYQDRPFQEESDLEYFSVDDLLKANLPTFWNYMTSVSKGLEVGELAELKNQLNINEKKLLDKLQQKIPEITELVEENENYEAEIQHFLVLRRAELKDLYKQIKRVKKELGLLKVSKVRDLDTVQGRIQALYDDIDTHLEDPNSSYNDDYILNRKRRISRLMKKRRVLKTDLKHLNYTKVQRKQKQLEFLLDRKKEIHEDSKNLTFKFTQKRVKAIQKNNARINYLISVSLPKKHIRKIRKSMRIIRRIREKIAKMENEGSKTNNNLSVEEQSIRFETEYYSQIEKREDELMDEIRRDREQVKGFRSRVRVDNMLSPVKNNMKGSNSEKISKNNEKSNLASNDNEYIYVYKTNKSPSSSKMISSKNGEAMWVFPVKRGTNILESIQDVGIINNSRSAPLQSNTSQNTFILQELEKLKQQNQWLQQELQKKSMMNNVYQNGQKKYEVEQKKYQFQKKQDYYENYKRPLIKKNIINDSTSQNKKIEARDYRSDVKVKEVPKLEKKINLNVSKVSIDTPENFDLVDDILFK
ncbi:MAG: hypothetical protein COB02_08950 [Candidatus Cloacimonadota bacterium]|nr:MAG: hypothetical protein COB02_08950 [Candidatus Cloacimonadota bacterium]